MDQVVEIRKIIPKYLILTLILISLAFFYINNIEKIQANEIKDVIIGDEMFSPRHVEVSEGTTVRWICYDQQNHTVTCDKFDSGVLSQGNTFEFTFNEPGTYEYHCELHGETGTVKVVESSQDDEGSFLWLVIIIIIIIIVIIGVFFGRNRKNR